MSKITSKVLGRQLPIRQKKDVVVIVVVFVHVKLTLKRSFPWSLKVLGKIKSRLWGSHLGNWDLKSGNLDTPGQINSGKKAKRNCVHHMSSTRIDIFCLLTRKGFSDVLTSFSIHFWVSTIITDTTMLHPDIGNWPKKVMK